MLSAALLGDSMFDLGAFAIKYSSPTRFWPRRDERLRGRLYPRSIGFAVHSKQNWQRVLFVFFGSALLAGCNVHPLVDDVSPIPNENIIASARCELRQGLVSAVGSWFRDVGITDYNPNFLANDLPYIRKRYGRDPAWADRIKGYETYLAIGVAYNWSFDITEVNSEDSKVGFQIPYINPAAFGITAGKGITKTRQAKRAFTTGETFAALLTKSYYDFCRGDPSVVATGSIPVGPIPRQPNIVYPIVGSIGLDKAVNTFLAVASQEGGDGGFVDTLTFTTVVTGTVHPTVTLNPVPGSFRLISADSTLTATRTDLHSVVISLAFPKTATATALADAAGVSAPETVVVGGDKKGRSTNGAQKSADTSADTSSGTAQGNKALQVQIQMLQSRDATVAKAAQDVHRLSTLWQARYNLCVQDGRNREDQLSSLRLTAPEVYCIEYADAFVPRVRASSRFPLSYSRAGR